MGGRASDARLLLGGLALGVFVSSCRSLVPPVNPGFVSTAPRHAGALDASLQGGVLCVSFCAAVGGGTLHLEPYIDNRSSLPVSLSMSAPGGSNVSGAVRLGVRHRLTPALALGVGAGPTLLAGTSALDPRAAFGGAVDLDVATSKRTGRTAVSFVGGAGWGFRRSEWSASGTGEDVGALFVPMELSGAYREVDDLWVTVHLLGGLAVGSIGYQGDTAGMGAMGLAMGVAWMPGGSAADSTRSRDRPTR